MKNKVYGNCKLCGEYKELSFEHVPPQRAFNSSTVKIFDSDEILKLMAGVDNRMPWDFGGLKGSLKQGGSGDYYLCRKCNNDTGSWYMKEYVDFTHKLYNVLAQCKNFSNRTPLTFTLHNIYPLRIFKAIMVMFCDLNNNCFNNEDISSFLLNKESKEFDSKKYSLLIYLTCGTCHRKIPLTAALRNNIGITLHSEISQFPIGELLLIDKPNNFNPGGYDISGFLKYDYNVCCDYTFLCVPYYEVNTQYPCDYRTQGEIGGLSCQNRQQPNII